MYVFLGISGPKSRVIVSVGQKSGLKSDAEAIACAYSWHNDSGLYSIVEVWNMDKDCFVCRLDF